MNDLKERLIKTLAALNGMRDAAVSIYLEKLGGFTAQEGCPPAADSAGILHDLDRHITNCELELKRIEAMQAMEVAHV